LWVNSDRWCERHLYQVLTRELATAEPPHSRKVLFMKRSWLIGAALVLSLTAVGCDDDGDDDSTPADGGNVDAGPGRGDAGLDGSIDSGKPDAGDAGDAG
jgi:hypothetical protein